MQRRSKPCLEELPEDLVGAPAVLAEGGHGRPDAAQLRRRLAHGQQRAVQPHCRRRRDRQQNEEEEEAAKSGPFVDPADQPRILNVPGWRSAIHCWSPLVSFLRCFLASLIFAGGRATSKSARRKIGTARLHFEGGARVRLSVKLPAKNFKRFSAAVWNCARLVPTQPYHAAPCGAVGNSNSDPVRPTLNINGRGHREAVAGGRRKPVMDFQWALTTVEECLGLSS